MAEEVQQVVRSKPGHRVLVMLGHEDGVIAWGESAEAAGLALVAILAHAFRLEA
jgi:rhamnose utilization protein RhaD (predicted bifunctional aldolase and dehydrogenase)